jgi:DNA-binding response OmpR family regulator
MQYVGGRRILVVEDNVNVVSALVLILVHEGHTVETVMTGGGAMMRASAFGADVVIIDLGLPDLRGEDVARFLRATTANTLLIGITADAPSTVSREQREPFDALLHKPFGPDELLRLL